MKQAGVKKTVSKSGGRSSAAGKLVARKISAKRNAIKKGVGGAPEKATSADPFGSFLLRMRGTLKSLKLNWD